MSVVSRFGWPALVLGVSYALFAAAAASANTRPDYSGVWIANEALSENPREKMLAAMPRMMRRMAERRADGPPAPQRRMEIVQTEDAITMRGSEAREQTLTFDGTPASDPEERMTSSAAWEDDQLVISSSSARGATFHRRHVLNEDGSRLTIYIRIEHPQLSEVVTAQRVFDRQNLS